MKIDQLKFLASGMSLKKKAFTLIELLVVIAIIAILATVVIVNVTGARAKAQKTQVQNGMAVAAKVAASCVTFGGSLIEYTNTPANPSFPSASDNPVCDTSQIGDSTEQAAATGKYPKLPDGYSYSVNIGGTLPVVTASDDALLACTVKGCGNWSALGSGDGSVSVTVECTVCSDGAGSTSARLVTVDALNNILSTTTNPINMTGGQGVTEFTGIPTGNNYKVYVDVVDYMGSGSNEFAVISGSTTPIYLYINE